MTTHQIILLDQSGSMSPCRDATISSYNELVQDVARRASAGGDRVTVTLVTFSGQVSFVRFCEPADTLVPLTAREYAPDGMTALHDAIGAAIHRFKAEVPDEPGARYLVAIVTDGMENASQHYTREEVAALIGRRRETGRWSFSLLGANQDVRSVSAQMNIVPQQAVSYAATDGGTIGGWKRLGATMVCSVRPVEPFDRAQVGTVFPPRDGSGGSEPGGRGGN